MNNITLKEKMEAFNMIHLENVDVSDDTPSHGKEVISLIQLEQTIISQLQDLSVFFSKSTLRGKLKHLDDITQLLNAETANHQNMHEAIVSGKCSLTEAIRDLPSCAKQLVLLSSLILSDLKDVQNACVSDEDKELEMLHIGQLLFDPEVQVSKYKEIFQNLCLAVPEEIIYDDILIQIENLHYELKTKSSLRKNAMNVLRIQQFLVDRQPKVVSPGRVLLKEGCLYKVSYKNNKLKKMVLVLFDDIILCCRITRKSPNWQTRNSLKCRAVLPVHLCSISFAAGSSSVKGSTFKLKCLSVSYLLLSRTPGDSQNWIREIQSAIRRSREDRPVVKFYHKEEFKENQHLQPFQNILTSWWNNKCS